MPNIGGPGSRPDRSSLTIAIVGSRQLDTSWLAGPLIVLFHALPSKLTVLLRAPMEPGEPGGFEQEVARICAKFGIAWEYVRPTGGGRQSVYHRDYDMVSRSDRVLAFFPPDEPMSGGTVHIVDAALAKLAPVHAWSIDGSGNIERIGELNPDTDGPR